MAHSKATRSLIRAMRATSSPRIMDKRVIHRPQQIADMAGRHQFQLQDSALTIRTVTVKLRRQIIRVRTVFMGNRIMVAVLVTKTPSLSDVIKDIRHLINIRSLILYLSRQQFSQAKRKKKRRKQIESISRRTIKGIMLSPFKTAKYIC
ncbi:hypothetical protein ALC60_04678 [Trachymyrmex zeteki]|uniref:Uncharacterized protein n=1 Tax=Mycetomoellerius zeteki TaxID=64791 RepID=A0A151X7P8_9HYME|nr:hypothetical protein ALC60_04678 [Trachymyrmex zeteki]